MQSIEEFRLDLSTSIRIRKEKKKREFRTLRRDVVQAALQDELHSGMYKKYQEFQDQNILARNIDTLLQNDHDLHKVQLSLRFLRQVSTENTSKILKYLGQEGLERLFLLIIKLTNSFSSNKLLMIDCIWLLVNFSTEIDAPVLQTFLIKFGTLKLFRKLLQLQRDQDYNLLFEIILHFYANVAGVHKSFSELVLDIEVIDFLKIVNINEPHLFKKKSSIIFFLFRNLAPSLIHGFISEIKFVTRCAINYIIQNEKDDTVILEDALIVLERTSSMKQCIKLAKDKYLEQNLLSILMNSPDDKQILVNFTCFFNSLYYYESDLPLLFLKFFSNDELKIEVRSAAGLALANLCGNQDRSSQITEIAQLEEIQSAILQLLKPMNQFKIIKQTSALVDNILRFAESHIVVEFLHAGILLRISQVLTVKNNRKFNRNALNCLHQACSNSEVLGMAELKEIQAQVNQNLDILDDLCKKDESKLGMFMRVTEMLGLRRGDDEECKGEEQRIIL